MVWGRNASIMHTSRSLQGQQEIYSVFLFSTCHALKTRCELSRVKLYKNDLKGNKNYFEFNSGRFELARGSSYRG